MRKETTVNKTPLVPCLLLALVLALLAGAMAPVKPVNGQASEVDATPTPPPGPIYILPAEIGRAHV